jgi:outer membrane protein OmpA-like peptidoglycan-associated protein
VFALVTGLLLSAAPPLGARLDLGLELPVSAPQSSYFTPGPGGSLSLEYELLRFLDVEAQVGWLMLPRSSTSPATAAGTLLSVGAGVRVRRPFDQHVVIPWGEVLVNYGASAGSRLPLTVSAGLSFRPAETSGFLVGVFARFQQIFALEASTATTEAGNASLVSFGVSVEYLQSHDLVDTDGDGVPDVRDTCPEVSAPGTADGCSAPPLVSAVADRDGDGIPDDVDKCPDQAEDKDGYQDEDGCPEADNDHDGLADAADACPNEAGPAAAKGCPDKDGDGIADRDDACPTVAGLPEDKGCPKYKQLVVTESKIEIKQKIFFAYGSTKILPRSDPLLAEVAQALQDRANLCVRIEGHTDNQGSRAANLTLSDGRAKAVREALSSRGVPDARLTSKGYADELPIDTNATLEGRENNRRVEFVIVPCAHKETP